MTNDTFTSVSDIGEFGLIDRIRDILGPASNQITQGIGDDTAVVPLGQGKVQLITTDALIEGVHFDRTFMPMGYLGFKSIAVNVSDIASMNGKARHAVVALGLPSNVSVEMVESLYGGMKRACDAYGVEIVGGDTTASHGLVLSVTVLGTADESDVSYRGGADVGDLVCVTGDVGSAYAGLKALVHQKRMFEEEGDEFQPDLDPYRYVVQRQLMPQARVDVIRELKMLSIKPTAMIDISDGLASEINHICDASLCGAVIQKESIPIHEQTRRVAEESDELPLSYALHGGEDYELLFTISPADKEKVEGIGISIIGGITPVTDGIKMLAPGGDAESLESSGFRHF